MSAWTRYTLTYDDTYTDVVVDVKDPASAEMIALCALINNFWSGADERMSEADGDVVQAVLMMLCRCALAEEIRSNFGAVYEFTMLGVEGWPKLDGSDGIRLVNVEPMDFSGDVSISAKPAPVAESEGA
jgi:hypothetical protein